MVCFNGLCASHHQPIAMALAAGSTSSHRPPGSSPQAVFALLSNAQQLAAGLPHVPGMQDISQQLHQMLQQHPAGGQPGPALRSGTGSRPAHPASAAAAVTRQQGRQLPPFSSPPAEPAAPLVSLAAAVAAALRQEQQADDRRQQHATQEQLAPGGGAAAGAADAHDQGQAGIAAAAAAAAAAGTAAKSVLLELADQLGAAALAAAEAASASGQPLSYQQVMAQVQAGWEQWLGTQGHSLADVLGAELQQPAGRSSSSGAGGGGGSNSLDPQQLHKVRGASSQAAFCLFVCLSPAPAWDEGVPGACTPDPTLLLTCVPAWTACVPLPRCRQLFYFSQHYATAHVLRVGTTKFKRDSRALGLERWPQRWAAGPVAPLGDHAHASHMGSW